MTLSQTSPEIRAQLETQLSAFEASQDEQEISDEEVLAHLKDILRLRHLELELANRSQEALVESSPERPPPKQIRERRGEIEEVRHHLESHLQDRLGSAEEESTPRLWRLSRRLELSWKETKALAHIVLQRCDASYPDEDNSNAIKDLIRMADFTSSEAFHFLRSGSRHLEEGVFSIERRLDPSIFEADFSMPDEVVKVLVGAELTTDEILRIDGTVVAEVLGVQGALTHAAREFEAHTPADSDREIPVPISRESEPSEPGTISGPEAGKRRRETSLDREGRLSPYRSDLEYLESHFEWIASLVELRREELEGDPFRSSSDQAPEVARRELRGRMAVQENLCRRRLAATRADGWLPRLERLVEERGLDEFERCALLFLLGLQISDRVCKAGEVSLYTKPTVNEIIVLLKQDLEERIDSRRYFYKSAPLVEESIVYVSDRFLGDLGECKVSLDRRMLEHLAGLESEPSELIDGSYLSSPTTTLDQVVLPQELEELVVGTVEAFPEFQQAREALGFDDVVRYGRGITLLFHGPPGTGKTMFASALANHLGKKILLVNLSYLGGDHAGEIAKLIFREARIHDAITFFDECDSIFRSRKAGNRDIFTLLTEMERHEGLVIMATNRPQVLDEAMHRRITLALEFRNPDMHQRERIWRQHVPPTVETGEIDFGSLAIDFEINGGYIKNAVLSGLLLATRRDGGDPKLTESDLRKGARLQLRRRLDQADLDYREVPKKPFSDLLLPTTLRERLEEIIGFEKARAVLLGQWGFGHSDDHGHGIAALFHGAPGTGKTAAAEAICFETGRPMKKVDYAAVLSRYVGDTTKNLSALFEEARREGAVLVFDEAEGLFGERSAVRSSSDRYANIDVGTLLHRIERFPGLVILTTNRPEDIDDAFLRRLQYVLEFPIPDTDLRSRLWRFLLPEKTPLQPDIDFDRLAEDYPLPGGHIRNAIFKAAARAALRKLGERMVSSDDLERAAEEEAALQRQATIGFAG